MTRAHCILIIGVLLLLCFPVRSLAENRALLIGVGRYQVEDAYLPGISHDLELMHETARLMGFTESQIKVLGDSQATLAEIRSAMEQWLIQGTGPEDQALFYFSGHGTQIRDDNGDEDDGADEALCPYDLRLDAAAGTLQQVLLDDELGALLGRVRARRITVLIDACHSGTATRRFRTAGGGEGYYKVFTYPGAPRSVQGGYTADQTGSGGNIVALAASRDDQKAIATNNGSLFTRGVYEAVRDAVRLGHNITLAEIRASAESFIRNMVPPGKPTHQPTISGNQSLAQSDLKLDLPPARVHGDVWAKLEKLADGAPGRLCISSNGRRFAVGDKLVLTCELSGGGYLNILNIGQGDQSATVLFPNSFQEDNRVVGGQTLTIPPEGAPFDLAATEKGETLVVVFLTQAPINAYRDGLGADGILFKSVSAKSLGELEALYKMNRAFKPQASSPEFAAAKIVAEIE